MGTAKAVLSESSDDSNQALSMAILTSALGTGLVLGPAVAGAIADPIGQYNLTITSRLWLNYTHYSIYNSLRSSCTLFSHHVPLLTALYCQHAALHNVSHCCVHLVTRDTWKEVSTIPVHGICTNLNVYMLSLYRSSKSHKSEDSILNSLVTTDEFNGEAGETVPQEGHCPAEYIEKESNGGEDEISHLRNGTVQDSSVQQQQSTEPSGLCVLITNPSMCTGNTFPLQLLRRRTAGLQDLSCQEVLQVIISL